MFPERSSVSAASSSSSSSELSGRSELCQRRRSQALQGGGQRPAEPEATENGLVSAYRPPSPTAAGCCCFHCFQQTEVVQQCPSHSEAAAFVHPHLGCRPAGRWMDSLLSLISDVWTPLNLKKMVFKTFTQEPQLTGQGCVSALIYIRMDKPAAWVL